MLRRIELHEGSPYLRDESKMEGHGDLLYIPDDESDIIEAVVLHRSSGTSLTVAGMRTGVCGGCIPYGGDVLSVEKLNGILALGKDDRGLYLRVQPAVTVRELNAFLRRKDYLRIPELDKGAREAASSAEHGLFYPVDPTELNSSIGGNISTNASGPRTYKYGPTRNWIRRIRMIVSDGSVIDITRGDISAVNGILTIPTSRDVLTIPIPKYEFNTEVKNAAGLMTAKDLDAIDIMVGSDGMFGVITEADVYVIPSHPLISNIMFFPSDEDAYAFVRDIRMSEVKPEFLEFFDSGSLDLIRSSRTKDPRFTGMPDVPDYAASALFFDLPSDDSLCGSYSAISRIAEEHNASLDHSWCGHELSDRERMFSFRHSVPQTIFDHVASLKDSIPGMHKMGTDMSVPVDRLDDMVGYYHSILDSAGLEYVIFGHIGNAHLHVEIILRNMDDLEHARKAYRALAEKAVLLGGSPSAEHGIGKLKRDYIELMYGKEGVEDIKRVKSAFDPDWMFNPGCVVVR